MNFANRDHLTKETYKLHIGHGERAHMQNRVTTNPESIFGLSADKSTTSSRPFKCLSKNLITCLLTVIRNMAGNFH